MTCELAPASSIYGTGDWSWIPPGLNCTYRLGEEGRVTVPPPAMPKSPAAGTSPPQGKASPLLLSQYVESGMDCKDLTKVGDMQVFVQEPGDLLEWVED